MLVVIHPEEFNYSFIFVRYMFLAKDKGKGMYKNRLQSGQTRWTQ